MRESLIKIKNHKEELVLMGVKMFRIQKGFIWVPVGKTTLSREGDGNILNLWKKLKLKI